MADAAGYYPTDFLDFSGGITDDAVGSKPNQYIRADNLLLDDSGKPISRPGSVLFDTANPQLPTGNQRINQLFNYGQDTALFSQSARHLYRYNSGWSELTGASGNPAFDVATTAGRTSYGEWKNHLFLCTTERDTPTKIYVDSGSTYRVRTAGLPKFVTNNAYAATTVVTTAIRDLANGIRTAMKAHFVDATAHPVATDTVSNGLVSASALVAGDSFATAVILVNQLIAAYKNHYVDVMKSTGSRAYHSNSLGDKPGAPNILLKDSSTATTWLQLAQQLNDLKVKYNWHLRGMHNHPYASIPAAGAGNTVTATSLASVEEGPIFSDLGYSKLYTLANTLRSKFNAHIADTTVHSTSITAFAGLLDTLNTVDSAKVADATDLDSLIELTIQMYVAYENHHADALFPYFVGKGDTQDGTRNKIFGVVLPTTTYAGGPNSVAVGMYVALRDLGAGFPNDVWPAGTTVTALGTDFTMSASHDNGSGVGTYAGFNWGFSRKAYHTMAGYLQETDPAASLLATSLTFDQVANNAGLLNTMLRDIATKYLAHDRSRFYHNVTPWTATDSGANQFVIPDTGGSHSYLYAFVFRYSYTALSGEIFEDVSTPYYKIKTATDTITDVPTQITSSSLSSISNGATLNYDTANITVDIYRSTDFGSVLYFANRVANGYATTTTVTDAISDTELVGNAELYTNGGVVSNDPPPKAKYFHITSLNYAYYGDILDGTDYFPNRVRQAVANDPDSCPGSFFLDLPEPCLGISSMKGIPITWTKDSTYRIEGAFDELGRGEMIAVPISSTIGLKASSSPVQLDTGIVFAGTDGFYFTDAYRVYKLSEEFNASYKTLTTNATRCGNILGVFDKAENRVWWATSKNADENDSCYVLDLDYGIKEDGAFTTASGGVSFAPTALCMFNNQIIRADTRGYIFKHDPTYTSDPVVNTGTAGSTWPFQAVTYDYLSVASYLGSEKHRKYVPKIEVNLKRKTPNISLQVNSYNDLSSSAQALTPIRNRASNTHIAEKRFFPSGYLRCHTKQIGFTNAKVIITNSDTLGTGVLNHAAKTLTLAVGPWPTDPINHVIAFENDGYVTEWVINTRAATVLTLTDAGGTLPTNGTYKWVMRGYPKDEQLYLYSYTVWAELLGDGVQSAYGETGANA